MNKHDAAHRGLTDTVQRSTAGAPGKSTLTSKIQRKARPAGADDAATVQQAASAGTAGAGGPMPHADAIQRSFGRHDVSGIESHQGGAADDACDAMGAQAFATGNHVAFRGSPDLHTAAHEAAHVVQQQAGVQLAGGVGQSGDRYEQHADAVADAVVAGRSAEALLDQHAGAGGASGAVQRLRDDENKPDPEGQCKELSTLEIVALLGKISFGMTITPSEQRNLRIALEKADNATFATYMKGLDTLGVLQKVLQKLHGHAGTEGGGDQQREFPVLCYRFWNAADQVDADVATANTIYGHHGIMITAVSKRTIAKADAERIVGHEVEDDFKLDRSQGTNIWGDKRFTHADMKAVVNELVPKDAVAGLWVKGVITENGSDLAGTSSRAGSFGNYHRLAAVATDFSGPDTFAHELGHMLIDKGHTKGGLMQDGGKRDKDKTGADLLTDEDVTKIRASALGWARTVPTA